VADEWGISKRVEQGLSKWIDHQGRIIDLESKVESLHYHHRHDRVLERLNELDAVAKLRNDDRLLERINDFEALRKDVLERLGELEAAVKLRKGNGNGASAVAAADTERRLRWLERLMWMGIGAMALFELWLRVRPITGG
jgi:hypothetical protein